MNRRYSFEPLAFRCQPIQRYEEFVRSRGMRVTQSRKIIFDAIFRRRGLFGDEQLLSQIAKEQAGLKVGRATVYRTLQELVAAGLLRQEPLS